MHRPNVFLAHVSCGSVYISSPTPRKPPLGHRAAWVKIGRPSKRVVLDSSAFPKTNLQVLNKTPTSTCHSFFIFTICETQVNFCLLYKARKWALHRRLSLTCYAGPETLCTAQQITRNSNVLRANKTNQEHRVAGIRVLRRPAPNHSALT